MEKKKFLSELNPGLHLTADSSALSVSLSGELTAADVETLISDLSEFRANMNPPVPMERPVPGKHGSAERVQVQDEPSLMAVPLKDGRVRLYLRNQGLGWLVFNFSVDQSIALRDFLISNAADSDSAVSLFFDDPDNRGAMH